MAKVMATKNTQRIMNKKETIPRLFKNLRAFLFRNPSVFPEFAKILKRATAPKNTSKTSCIFIAITLTLLTRKPANSGYPINSVSECPESQFFS